MQRLGFKLLNDITWVKPNPPPNLCCRYFTHATETVLWARRDTKARHKFNYALMKRLNSGKQMKSVWGVDYQPSEVENEAQQPRLLKPEDDAPSVWTVEPPKPHEKVFGKHPTQKPVALLERIIAASTDVNDLVLDPFSGSGTTGIAAARLNRKFIGIETEKQYLEKSRKRYDREFKAIGFSPLLQAEREASGRRDKPAKETAAIPGGLFPGPDKQSE